MNLDLDVREIQAQVERLRDMPQLMRYPLATALTRTAVQVKAAQQAEMRDSFDRPTPYTLGAIFMTPATAASMVATVGVKDQASGGRAPLAWLRWQIYGGLRRLTGFERALVRAGAMDGGDRSVPAAYAKLDAFGNLSRGQMAQVLSQLRVETGRLGSSRTLPTFVFGDSKADRNRKRNAMVSQYRRAGGEFLALPYGRGKLKPGLYLIDRFNRKDVQPVLRFVSKAAYQPGLYDFFGSARYVIDRELQPQVSRAVGEFSSRLLVPGAKVQP
jgi:hypothetical protein